MLARPVRVCHRKSGQTYRRLGFVLQPTAEGPPRRHVLYASENVAIEKITGMPLEPGTLWIRSEEEFTPERFESLDQ